MNHMQALGREVWRPTRRTPMAGGIRVAVVALALIFVGTARSLSAQAGNPVQLAPPDTAKRVPAPPVPAVVPVQWWCEINAAPIDSAQMTADEANLNFFVSQIIPRQHRADVKEEKDIVRSCRTAFEVQFGAHWKLVTARAQHAATVSSAKLGRSTDMRTGDHDGHARDFRIPR